MLFVSGYLILIVLQQSPLKGEVNVNFKGSQTAVTYHDHNLMSLHSPAVNPPPYDTTTPSYNSSHSTRAQTLSSRQTNSLISWLTQTNQPLTWRLLSFLVFIFSSGLVRFVSSSDVAYFIPLQICEVDAVKISSEKKEGKTLHNSSALKQAQKEFGCKEGVLLMVIPQD